LIDVRTPAEYETAHIEGSVLMPLDQVDCAAVRAAAEGSALRVLVCQSGIRAGKAAAKLAAGGDPNFVVLDGGVAAWGRAGLPLIRGRFTLPLERQVFIAAGFLVFVGVILGWQVHPGFYGLSGFVGAGLMMAGLTGFCPMAILIGKLPWNQRGASCGGGSSCCAR
jgi:rhodanese-related sulfurtransferase